jgi:hypothetical protein
MIGLNGEEQDAVVNTRNPEFSINSRRAASK